MSGLYIILAAEQATRAWSGSHKETALRPVPLVDGETCVLPARVVERGAHGTHHEHSMKLLQCLVEESKFHRGGFY